MKNLKIVLSYYTDISLHFKNYLKFINKKVLFNFGTILFLSRGYNSGCPLD